uniref:Transposase n=1 Tax=Roseihalotalea indica TaxID=2867963 RepID=A0AA49GPI8_9BACT|nr:transposase [Tunicatimonas sp. TK19036]
MPALGWQAIEKIIVVQRTGKWDLQEIINTIFYVTKNGYVWRDLPSDFPPWPTVYWYYQKWVRDGIWKNISDCLTVDYRIKQGKNAQPTLAIIDSQSIRNSSTCTASVGIDGGKCTKGRKRFFIADTLGCLLDSFVVAANRYDGVTAAQRWACFEKDNILLTYVKKVYADGTLNR